MSDLISREEMISQLKYCLANFTDYKEALEETLRKVKGTRGVEPQEWISVKERLPEKGERVMACDIDGDIMIGWMHDRTHLCAADDYYKNITAWMPLPEPWKGDEE